MGKRSIVEIETSNYYMFAEMSIVISENKCLNDNIDNKRRPKVIPSSNYLKTKQLMTKPCKPLNI